MVQNREGESKAEGMEFFHPVRRSQARALIQSGGPGKKRGGMAVLTQAQQDQVKARRLARDGMEEFAQLIFIILGGGFRRKLGAETMDVFRRDGHPREQGLIRHAIVAVRMVRRDGALVAKKEMDF